MHRPKVDVNYLAVASDHLESDHFQFIDILLDQQLLPRMAYRTRSRPYGQYRTTFSLCRVTRLGTDFLDLHIYRIDFDKTVSIVAMN